MKHLTFRGKGHNYPNFNLSDKKEEDSYDPEER
jgi:hypothetical protein